MIIAASSTKGRLEFFLCRLGLAGQNLELNVDKSFPVAIHLALTAMVNRAYGIGSGRVWIVLDRCSVFKK